MEPNTGFVIVSVFFKYIIIHNRNNIDIYHKIFNPLTLPQAVHVYRIDNTQLKSVLT